jgi:hypothetical protein
MNDYGFHIKADGQVYTCVSRKYFERGGEMFRVNGAEACKAALRLMNINPAQVQETMWTANYKRGYNVYP